MLSDIIWDMNDKIVILDKPIGKTPLQMVDKFKREYFFRENETVSYAGRLDPMAHGLLILLIGDENKQREKYLHLDKTYEVEILFGFATDTYDVLGKVTKVSRVPQVPRGEIEKELQTFVGKREQEYPPYSSKAVGGKPLFWWARENKLSEIEIPKKEVEIFSIAVISERGVGGEELLRTIEERIGLVFGNFRQEEILRDWKKNIAMNQTYPIVKIRVSCSSGTYMRSLAHDLGKRLECGAIAYDIYRTKVGEFNQNTTADLPRDLSKIL